MNIVELIKDQLAGAAGKQLGGMVGAEGADLEKLVGAGLPTVLSGLKGLASSKAGADKLADSIKGLDIGSNLDFGKLLGGGNVSSMLAGLFGGKIVEGLATVVAKFTGLNTELVKKGLTYLMPIVLGSVGSKLGGKPDGASLFRFFEEQKANIDQSVPKGLNFASIPDLAGFLGNASESAKETTNRASQSAEQSSGNAGRLLLPLALLLTLLAAAFFLFQGGSGQKPSTPNIPTETKPSQPKQDVEAATPSVVNEQQSTIQESTEAPPAGISKDPNN